MSLPGVAFASGREYFDRESRFHKTVKCIVAGKSAQPVHEKYAASFFVQPSFALAWNQLGMTKYGSEITIVQISQQKHSLSFNSRL
jgi:hypothetical protein